MWIDESFREQEAMSHPYRSVVVGFCSGLKAHMRACTFAKGINFSGKNPATKFNMLKGESFREGGYLAHPYRSVVVGFFGRLKGPIEAPLPRENLYR